MSVRERERERESVREREREREREKTRVYQICNIISMCVPTCVHFLLTSECECKHVCKYIRQCARTRDHARVMSVYERAQHINTR